MPVLPLAGRRILIAEDEAILAIFLAETLQAAGATVIESGGTVGEALDLTGEDLDAAVLDVNLSGTLVFPVAEALAARGIPIVLHTAYVLQMDMAPLGRVRVCQKPSTSAEIVAALCDLLSIDTQNAPPLAAAEA